MERAPLAVVLVLASCQATGAETVQRELDTCRQERESFRRAASEYVGGLEEQKSARHLAEQRLTAYRDIVSKLTQARWDFEPGELSFDIRRGQLVVELPYRVLFAPGETRLEPRGREALRQIASILKTLEGRRFLVAGHTDNVPVAKKKLRAANNWELGAQRAIAVVSFLQREGVDPTQLGVVSYGQHQPLASNANEAGRSRNRRIEILIMPTVAEIVPLPDEIGGDVPSATSTEIP